MSYSSINRVVLIGRLTTDPELRALPSGDAVCELRLACNGVRKEGDGEYVEKPNFFSVIVYGAQAEPVHRYTSRGRRVGVDGRLQWREWETAEGLKRQTVEVVAGSVQFLDSPSAEGGSDEQTSSGFDGDAQEAEGSRELVGVGAHDDFDF
ncbi:MAG TPA: single-stranded DNA-binding protein [Solirubrobacteraceae bacterium]|nr:single-stranded DNA-binding protein [Solirubrobacteraceae bacterium]